MGNALIAERLGCSVKEAAQILENFYKGFPRVKGWKDSVENFAKTNGYVEDLWGRRRRLPNLFLPKFVVEFADKSKNITFNPLLGSKGKVSTEAPQIKKYREAIENCRGFKEADAIKEEAKKEGIIIFDNSGKISTAERQCVNSVVQGSAATMTKKAMIDAYNDPELNALGFKMLIPVHDELIGECPKENVSKVAKRLSEVMIAAPGNDVSVPFKCDAEEFSRWYIDALSAEIHDEGEKLDSTLTVSEKCDILLKDYPFIEKDQLAIAIQGEQMNF